MQTNQYLERNTKKILVFLFFLSLIIRCCYYLEIRRSPLVQSHQWDGSDMNFFHIWAKQISQGDWLTRDGLHPYHIWHKMVANITLKKQDVPESEGKELWNTWYQGKRFHQEPLYPYFLAILYRIFGTNSQDIVFWIQFLLGALSNVFLFLLAQRYFDSITALLSAILAMLYGPFMFHEVTLLRTSCVVFLNIFTLWLLSCAWNHRKAKGCFWAGFFSGISILMQMTFALFLISFLIPFSFRFYRQNKRMLAILFLGFILALSPSIVRNILLDVPAWQLSSVGEVTFIASNQPDFTIDQGWTLFPKDMKNISLVLEKSSGKAFSSFYHTLCLHPSCMSYLHFLCKKFFVVWNCDEIPNNVNYYYGALYSNILFYGQIHFSMLMSFFLWGILLNLRYWKKYYIFYSFIITNVFLLTIFYCLSRFKTPLIIVMMPFAANGIIFLAKRIWQKQYKLSLSVYLFLLLLNLFSSYMTPRLEYRIPFSEYILGNNTALVWSRTQKEPEKALAILEKCLDSTFSSEFLYIAQQKSPIKSALSKRFTIMLHSFSQIYLEASKLAAQSGQKEKEQKYYEYYLSMKVF